MEDKLCVFCSAENEDLDHLGFLCFFAAKVWEKIAVWLDIRLTVSLAGSAHFSSFFQELRGKMEKKQIGIIWLATIWSLWNSRNNFIFNNSDIVLDEVVVGIKMVSWIWLSAGVTNRVFISFYFWFQAPLVALKNL
ncbi:uncharacterized protein LOC131629556 [Vicia villosa]|uniref:uncharacterized protein LOC131629556 n=1 Tax=Vicia villosa TaxID=3911 RepID=UPI00273C9B6D|nr:uncharacterized protein LOC131629556 [Vicia villosa]